VTELAETNNINHDVAAKLHPEIKRHTRHKGNSFWIVAVDVKDWRFNHL
jgi:hypothetical protein